MRDDDSVRDLIGNVAAERARIDAERYAMPDVVDDDRRQRAAEAYLRIIAEGFDRLYGDAILQTVLESERKARGE